MPSTHGFEVVAEISVPILNQMLRAAWKSGAQPSDTGVIPQAFDIPPNLAFGPYQLADGTVQIPQNQLNLAMAPEVNGVDVKLGTLIQVHIRNPPVRSASYFDLTADIHVKAPVAVIADGQPDDVGVNFVGLPRANVTATLTSGDPVGPLTLTMIQEYVHARYKDGTIPSTISQPNVTFGIFSADAFLEVFDDPTDSNHQITVSRPAPAQVEVRIPIHLTLSKLKTAGGLQPASPMGVETKIILTAPLDLAPGSVTARLTAAGVGVDVLAPADGVEGGNYTADKIGASSFGLDLDALLKDQLRQRGQSFVQSIGDIAVVVPTVGDIETFIGDQVHAEVVRRRFMGVWTPDVSPDTGVTINGPPVPKALPDALAIALNPKSGANADALVNFLPAGRGFAIALDGGLVQDVIRSTIHRPESEGGFGPHFPPKRFSNVDGHDADLTRLDISLRQDAIHVEGDVTVIDAIFGSIDVDASFEDDVGLTWQDGADGSQTVVPLPGDPDVDLSLLGWIVAFLLGFISGGLIGGIIVVVVGFIVGAIASRVGGAIIRDDISKQIKGIGAWPQKLRGIGTVSARFDNPIGIDSEGLLFSGSIAVASTFTLTIDSPADAHAPYAVDAGTDLTLTGGPPTPDTRYLWDLGDGTSATGSTITHVYAVAGLYVVKLTTIVDQAGGARTRRFGPVLARDVAPRVGLGRAITIDEGQEVEFVADFTDPEWPDTHTAVFRFGDDSPPVIGRISETNTPPQAQGNASARHAYCDNGDYTVTAHVRDDEGAVGTASLRVTVRNVAPTVDAGPERFAYPCTPLTLVGGFRDPGWCDTHTATWDFGDCTPPRPAVVRERNDPPAAVGIAAVAHIYRCCGTFLARCTVADDDGGVGTATTVVRVVDVKNRHFEDGFRSLEVGAVANEWEPYLAGADGKPFGGEVGGGSFFAAEPFVVHGGRRSQRIGGARGFRAGLYQQVGANCGWDYQVTTWYQLDERAGGVCRLGLDPTGGTDPAGPSVQWVAGRERHDWGQLAGRVTAAGAAVTVFLEATAGARDGTAYFDEVELIAYPCPLEFAPPPPPPTEEKACVDWKDEREPHEVAVEYEKGGFRFSPLAQNFLRIVLTGSPLGQGKLALPGRGLRVVVPFAADRVVARVAVNAGEIAFEALDAAGVLLGQKRTGQNRGRVQALEVSGRGIASLRFTGGGGESTLIELCVFRSGRPAAEEETRWPTKNAL